MNSYTLTYLSLYALTSSSASLWVVILLAAADAPLKKILKLKLPTYY